MVDLYSFIKSLTLIDLVAIFLVFFVSFCLIVSEIGFLIWAKRKRWLYIFIVLAFLPLIIALADAAFRIVISEGTLNGITEIDEPLRDILRAEHRKAVFMIIALGLVGSAIPLAIGGAGLLFKKDQSASN